MAAQLYKTSSGRLFHAGAVALVLVGLPARGKTHVSRSLRRYLRWIGVRTEVFSLGNKRRDVVGLNIDCSFFDPANIETRDLRNRLTEDTINDMLQYFEHGGQCGIFDASNTDPKRRKELIDRLIPQQISVVFIENICTNPEIVAANIRGVKLTSPDYAGWNQDEALKDFERRIGYHAAVYQTIEEPDLSFVKLIDVGERIIVNNIKGYLPTRIVFYLMNLHITPRRIYFARSGQSMHDDSYKSDSPLSPDGFRYALDLTNYIVAHRKRLHAEESASGSSDSGDGSKSGGAEVPRPLTVWTSCRRRGFLTASYFEDPVLVRQKVQLAEINPGVCDGCTAAEIQAKFPQEWIAHEKDPYRHRFPRAESYHDLALRLEGVIMELEREKNDVLIIAHETVLRTLYAYLFDRTEKEIPLITIPDKTLIEIIPSAYFCKEVRHEIYPPDSSGAGATSGSSTGVASTAASLSSTFAAAATTTANNANR